MRFLADENFPRAGVAALAGAGHDVVWVHQSARGAGDRDVLAQAVAERRILLTFDKDFGDLARTSELPDAVGVVLFRVPLSRPAEIGAVLLALICSRSDWLGHFSVIEPGRIRMRPLNSRK